MEYKTQIPEQTKVEYQNGNLKVEKEGNTVERKLEHAQVDVKVENEEVIFKPREERKDIASIAKTFQSHLKNMINGLEEEYTYKMKGVYAHFPMTIKTENNQVLLENFLGERHPRKIDIAEGVNVKIDGEDLEITGPDKEAVGLTAGRIEQACKKGNRDPRTFQDGVYITSKGEEE